MLWAGRLSGFAPLGKPTRGARCFVPLGASLYDAMLWTSEMAGSQKQC